ncbi:NAD(P)H-dependent oxidoreductase [Sphingobacteriaceae bacterium WQ 2009]|uniref:NAD(P)H-dependent oxidoreductase n=1 Tax=Rhinopithecimicrobium faecis TaxID=2820698 RepID=A0A8T4H8Y5_9SPHI|nr:NAD(P)H-dependent oxidoreductase [Sphingobacteriaceae bacterium WQ 2009]
MNILAFAASNSSQSINKKFVTSVSKYYKEPEDVIEILDLNDYEMPLFSIDRELSEGIPQAAKDFATKIDCADFLLISLAEHNGSYCAAYKNIIDWVSRIPGRKLFNSKPVFLLATSPGAMGAATVLNTAVNRITWDGANVLDSFSLPSFKDNFEEGKGVINMNMRAELEAKVRKTKRSLKELFEQA